MIVIREKGLEFFIFEIWDCFKKEVFSGLPRSVDTSGGDCPN